jgi:hypothetical protein
MEVKSADDNVCFVCDKEIKVGEDLKDAMDAKKENK